jgi:hypothetical protein
MFSHRQIWRRLPVLQRSAHDKLYNSGLFMDNPHDERIHGVGNGNGLTGNIGTLSGGATSPLCPEDARPRELDASPDSVSAQLHKSRVKFNTAVRVVLIPTVAEYRTARLAEALWWADPDYKNFKESALAELREYLNAHPQQNSKSAISHLYQNDSAATTAAAAAAAALRPQLAVEAM